jgi:L-ascorbate metabolism protein UlaG (beta-lactamase superfamily)
MKYCRYHPEMGSLALTWWGHASATVEVGGVRVATDPLLADRLLHLRRLTETPPPAAYDADLVVVSHLHHDHLHLPSLRQFDTGVPILVPRGGEPLLRSVGPDRVQGVVPGDVLDVAGVRVTVLAATHDGGRGPHTRITGPPLGFRLDARDRSVWFPGDSELREDMARVGHVDLALVPIGGWGPTLEDGHMDPVAGAEAVRLVGATTAVPVHWGTFWPWGLRHVARSNHHRLFTTPGQRFLDLLQPTDVTARLAGHGERIEL